MSDWVKVVTAPLGLVGFALFLVFGLFSTLKRRDERRWLPLFAGIMALTALLGGLGLAFVQEQHASAVKSPERITAHPEGSKVQTGNISTSGNASPVVVGGSGSVTVNVDQSAQGYERADQAASVPAARGKVP